MHSIFVRRTLSAICWYPEINSILFCTILFYSILFYSMLNVCYRKCYNLLFVFLSCFSDLKWVGSFFSFNFASL